MADIYRHYSCKTRSCCVHNPDGKACGAVIELKVQEINHADGVKNIIKRLDQIYLKDKTQAAYKHYDKFE